MKITDIEVIELRVPGWTGATFDGSYDNCLVLVHTDGGVTGIAEVDSVPSVIRAIVAAPRSHTHAMGLKEIVVGQDPLQVEALWDRMYDWTSYYGRRGVVHALPQRLDVGRVATQKRFLQAARVAVRGGRVDDGADDGGHAVDLGDTGNTTVGMDEHEAVVV